MKNFGILSLSFFLLLQYNNISSQTNRFYYEFNYKVDSLGTPAHDLLVLLVNADKNIFLSSKFVEIDSINSLNNYEKQYITPQYKTILEFNKNNNVFTTYKKVDLNYYKYNFTKKINWKILNATKNILGFKVQKATTYYGGRKWTAWFTQEIALPFGPYVFHGLPGLILEINDNYDNFNFKLVKIQNDKNSNFILKNIFDQQIIEIKEKDWKTIQLNYFNNPLYNYKTIGWTMYNKNGEKFSTQDYRELEKRTKYELKRYNNPIELDEKINYK